MDVKLFVAVKALVVKGGKVLILREAETALDGVNPGKWGVPGGRIGPGEALHGALVREVKEEAGIQVSIGQVCHVDEWRPVVRGEQWQIVGTFYICKTEDKDIVLSDEHDEYKWIGPGEVDQYRLHSATQKAIEQYMVQ